METSNPQYSDKETERSRIFGVASVLYGSVHISGKEGRIVWSTAQQLGERVVGCVVSQWGTSIRNETPRSERRRGFNNGDIS